MSALSPLAPAAMAVMAASPPATPEAMRSARPQSMYATNVSPEIAQKSRPQSMMMGPPRSRSRLSVASSRGGTTRGSDEDGKTAVKVGKCEETDEARAALEY